MKTAHDRQLQRIIDKVILPLHKEGMKISKAIQLASDVYKLSTEELLTLLEQQTIKEKNEI